MREREVPVIGAVVSRRRETSLLLLLTVLGVALRAAEAAAPAPPSEGAPVSSQAQGILESVRSGVLQVQTLPIGSDSAYTYGSGFAVGTEGAIVTNYHVVSSVVMDPDRYRLEFVRQDGGKGPLAVVAIDAAHDLAVVRGDTGALPGLTFDPRVPEKGERGFSIGFPRNQGLTVTEGIVNGLSEDSVRGAIHFSGPVNAGMSGGPAVTAAGRVFGVNVSSLRGSQLISFIVPAAAASALVQRSRQAAAGTAAALFDALASQLRENASATLALWPPGALPVQRLGRFSTPGKPGDFATCWAQNEKDPEKLYRTAVYGCRSKDPTYVDEDLYLGHWAFTHQHVEAPTLGALRFAALQQSLFSPTDDTSKTSRLHLTRWSCQDRIVALPAGRAKAALCVRGYHRFEDLYDVELKLATLDRPGDGLISSLSLSGYGYPESMALAERFLGAVAWTP